MKDRIKERVEYALRLLEGCATDEEFKDVVSTVTEVLEDAAKRAKALRDFWKGEGRGWGSACCHLCWNEGRIQEGHFACIWPSPYWEEMLKLGAAVLVYDGSWYAVSTNSLQEFYSRE